MAKTQAQIEKERIQRAEAQTKFEKDIMAELGQRRTEGLKAHAASRVHGLLSRNGSDWDKAFEHISDHFRPILGKSTHKIFHPKYREKEAVRQLLLQATSGPSRVILTRLTIASDPRGLPAVEIQRQFGKQIGDNPSLTLLRIFMDCQYNLVTAYPDEP